MSCILHLETSYKVNIKELFARYILIMEMLEENMGTLQTEKLEKKKNSPYRTSLKELITDFVIIRKLLDFT